MDAGEILFVAQSADASCYHRILLPATALGCDWCGLDAPPPRPVVGRGAVRSKGGEPDLAGYRVLVVQTPVQDGWLELIPALQAGGTRVFFEVDYDLHALQQPPDALAAIEAAAVMCDGVICATERIAERYVAVQPNTHVCESGIDFEAYALTRPKHNTVNIGWVGRSLLPDEMRPWLDQIAALMRARESTNFISIGQPLADVVAEMGVVAPERCLAIPPLLPEQLPAAMSIFDIAFDPMGAQPWRRARSPLRWLESSAWGIPFVGDRRIYPRIEHGRTGFHAANPQAMAQELLRLVDDADLRARIGTQAWTAVAERYSMEAVAPQWTRAFEPVAA